MKRHCIERGEFAHYGRDQFKGDLFMRLMSSALHLAVLTLGLAFAAGAFATDETQLVDSINAFRSQAQRCAGQVSHELPPLTADPRLILPATGTTDLKQAMAQAAYPMVSVQ